MFGIGPTEMVLIFLVVLMLFGPSKLPQMARDFGRFVTEARRAVDEFKDELTSSTEDEEDPPHRRRKKVTARRKTSRNGDAGDEDGFLSKKEEEHDF
jgi:Tat protein translocase TatB subunit